MNRIQKLQEKLAANSAALVFSPHNRFYFTRFPSTDGILFVTREAAVFLIDSRYVEAARAEAKDCDVQLLESLAKQLPALAARYGVKTVGIEAYDLPVFEARRFAQMLPGVAFDESAALSRTIARLRMIKEPEELASMDKAQKITELAYDHILSYLKPGVTERDIQLETEYFMKKNGASGPSFDLITIFGETTSRPHGVPGDRKLKPGDFVTMDTGCIVDGYCSDMTRTVAVGHVTEEQKKVYDTVLKAQLAAEEALKPGKRCCDVDKIARDIIDGAGFEGCFGHGLGHSVGVLIHEEPRLSPSCDTVLEPGMTMTIEPGIYLEGRFGVRIEDMAVLTQDGCSIFTKCPKELVVL